MSAEIKKEIQLEIAHVLFIDIVGYSKLSINEQRGAVDEALSACGFHGWNLFVVSLVKSRAAHFYRCILSLFDSFVHFTGPRAYRTRAWRGNDGSKVELGRFTVKS
jgi:hypothetical protein